MGASSSSRRYSRRPMDYGYPSATVEDIYSGHYQASYPPQAAVLPVMPVDIDPYYQQQDYVMSGGLRRYNSDPNLMGFDPYQAAAFGGYEQFDSYDPTNGAYGAYGFQGAYEEPVRGRWGSLPMLNQEPEILHLARVPKRRPLLQKLFGPNSVAQRKKILSRLDNQQIDPLSKTAQWLMSTDDNPPPPPEQRHHRRHHHRRK